ncbi:hypothetical protein BH24ACT22_BH24ACT22_01850 [soil metagenome]
MEISQKRVENVSGKSHMLSRVSHRTGISEHRTHHVHRVARLGDGRLHAAYTDTFSPQSYSRFKHGDEAQARRYGHEVADLLMTEEAELFKDIRSDGVLVAAFPYKYVPTAAALMTNHTVTRLNHELVARDKPTVGHLHAFKYPWRASVEHHFPTMCEEERRNILYNVELSVDERRLRGVDLIVIDDVRVTGASQDRFLQLLYQLRGLRSLTVVFLCDVDPALTRTDPAVESELNHASVRTLHDVAGIVADGEFRWNIRVAKFVMEGEDLEAFEAFLGCLENQLLLTLQRIAKLLTHATLHVYANSQVIRSDEVTCSAYACGSTTLKTAVYRMITLNEYHLEPKYTHHVRAVRRQVDARELV